MMEFFRVAFLVAGALPLIAYPFAALASLMGLGSQPGVKAPLFNRVMNRVFLWGTLLYPVAFGVSYGWSEKGTDYGFLAALLPLFYLLLLWVSYHFMDAPPGLKTDKARPGES